MSDGEPPESPPPEAEPDAGEKGWEAVAPDPDPHQPRAWPVYLITVLMLPLTAWITTMVMVLIVLGLAGSAIAGGEIGFGDLGLYANQALARIFNPKLPQLIVGVLAASSTCAAVAIVLATRGKTPEARQLWQARLRLRRAQAADLALAPIGLLGLTFALDAVISLFGLQDYGALREMREAIEPLSIGERLLLSLVIAFGAGISEELYFRGFMLTRLERAHGRVGALIVTSIAFGIFHLDPLHVPVAAAMGGFLGASVSITGSIWPAIAAHIANNFLAVMFTGAETSTGTALIHLPAGLIVGLLALAAMRRRHRGEVHLPVW